MNKDEDSETNKPASNPFDSFKLKGIHYNDTTHKHNYDVLVKIHQSEKILMSLLINSYGQKNSGKDDGESKAKHLLRTKTSKFPLLFRTNSISRNLRLKRIATIENNNKEKDKERDTERERKQIIFPTQTSPNTFLTLQPNSNHSLSSFKPLMKESKKVKLVIPCINISKIKPQLQLKSSNIIPIKKLNVRAMHNVSLSDPNILSTMNNSNSRSHSHRHYNNHAYQCDFVKRFNDECKYHLYQARTLRNEMNKYSQINNSPRKVSNVQLEGLKSESIIIASMMDERKVSLSSSPYDQADPNSILYQKKRLDKYVKLSNSAVYKYRNNYKADINKIIHEGDNNIYSRVMHENYINKTKNRAKKLINNQQRLYIREKLRNIDYLMKKYKRDYVNQEEDNVII